MSKKQSCIEHIDALLKECDNVASTYNAMQFDTTEARKAYRKEHAVSKHARIAKQCIALRELLNALRDDTSLDNASNATRYILSLTCESVSREQFIICKDDTIMSLLMRYDNFSIKKVEKYCEKHHIKYDKQSKTFDFSSCDDSVLDTIDDIE